MIISIVNKTATLKIFQSRCFHFYLNILKKIFASSALVASPSGSKMLSPFPLTYPLLLAKATPFFAQA